MRLTVIEIAEASGFRGLAEQLPDSNRQHHYSLRDPAAGAVSGPPLCRHVLRAAGVLGRAMAADGSGELPALYLNGWKSLLCYPLDPQQTLVRTRFNLPGGARILSGLAYDDGSRAGGLLPGGIPLSAVHVWFGDDQGQLWSIGAALQPANVTPLQIKTQTALYATPVL